MRITFKKILRCPILMNFVFSLVLLVHVAFIGYRIKFPQHPSTKMYAKALDEFPVSFQICVKEQTNSQDRYIKFGYDNIWSFYKGITDYDGVWVGWAGHNSTKTSVKGKIIKICIIFIPFGLFRCFI